jgi:3-dehydroquinate dehydratase
MARIRTKKLNRFGNTVRGYNNISLSFDHDGFCTTEIPEEIIQDVVDYDPSGLYLTDEEPGKYVEPAIKQAMEAKMAAKEAEKPVENPVVESTNSEEIIESVEEVESVQEVAEPKQLDINQLRGPELNELFEGNPEKYPKQEWENISGVKDLRRYARSKE